MRAHVPEVNSRTKYPPSVSLIECPNGDREVKIETHTGVQLYLTRDDAHSLSVQLRRAWSSMVTIDREKRDHGA